MNQKPTSIDEIKAVVCEAKRVFPVGGMTKPALSTAGKDVTVVDMTGLSGVLAYDPGEFTFTAWAGTRVSEVRTMLDQNNQYLPFDPPLVNKGATLGGTVAAGLSGPGRFRYGGVRDFLLGISFVDSHGQEVHSGGKVVKNSAGFDMPKLFIGSMGRLGILAELTFKVFPKPEIYVTMQRNARSVDEAVEILLCFSNSQLDLETLDVQMVDDRAEIWARMGGLEKAMPSRMERLGEQLCGKEITAALLEGEQDAETWTSVREFTWVPDGWALVKVPLTPNRIPAFDKAVWAKYSEGAIRRYSGGGQVGWIALQDGLADLDQILVAQSLSGLVVFGPPAKTLLGVKTGESFLKRVKTALDPVNRFQEG